MIPSLPPLALVVALGTAVTMRLMLDHGDRSETRPVAAGRCEMNRDIERRLDLVVNGRPSLAPPPQTCPSPEPWREKQ